MTARSKPQPHARRSHNDYASEVFAYVSEKLQDERMARRLVQGNEEFVRTCQRAGAHPIATAGVIVQRHQGDGLR